MTHRIKSIVVTSDSVTFPEVGSEPKAKEFDIPPGTYQVVYIDNPGNKPGTTLPQLVVVSFSDKQLGMTERGLLMRASRQGAGFSLTLARIVSIRITQADIMLPVAKWVVVGKGDKEGAENTFSLPNGIYAILSEDVGAGKPQLVTVTHTISNGDEPDEEVTISMTAFEWYTRENITYGLELVVE